MPTSGDVSLVGNIEPNSISVIPLFHMSPQDQFGDVIEDVRFKKKNLNVRGQGESRIIFLWFLLHNSTFLIYRL